jgi:membrane protease YdiL (CAAX protease family)
MTDIRSAAVTRERRVEGIVPERRLLGNVVTRIRRLIGRHPIPSFIVLAFAFTWSLTPLVSVSIAFGLLALFGPAVAALIVSWADGTLGELRSRVLDWRRSPRNYAMAFAIPFAVAAIALAAYVLAGNTAQGLGAISAIEVVIFALVIGEEIGWRGFLMPRLRSRMGLAQAGLMTGIVWTLWHLPIYLVPGQGLAAFAVFAWWVVPLAVVMGYVTERANYSVLVATVMHGAANIATPILLPGIDRTWVLLVTGAVYVALALILVARSSVRRPAAVTTTSTVQAAPTMG